LANAGVPTRWARPVAKLFGVPAPCESARDCGDCEDCRNWYGAPVKTCGYLCQAACSKCSGGRCVDTCPNCEQCYPGIQHGGASCLALEALYGCKTCDPKTGKLSDSCSARSACEKCVQKQCVSNCPNPCELCDNGTCRSCRGRPCEGCNAQGICWRCDPECERCNSKSGECESTCDGDFVCCDGTCINCCTSCTQGACDGGADARCADNAKKPACCGKACHDLDSDNEHCGSCWTSCKGYKLKRTGEQCERGRCVCRGKAEWIQGVGYVSEGGGMECREKNHECCDGKCVDVASYQSDPKHCGKCIVQCEKDEKCVKGECVGRKKETISIRLAYVGFKFVESTPEDCPGMRPGGKEVLTAELRLVSASPEHYLYVGSGRFSADIDGCGLTPNRQDPGMWQNNEQPGGFKGDNFLGCKVTTVVPEHPVRVRVEIDMVDARRPNYVEIEWEPAGGPVDVRVSTGCEPAYEAGYVTGIPKEYRRRQRRQVTDYDLLPRLAPGGRLREGVYRSVDDEGLTITVGGEIEIPSLVDE
jgi:hypothetical protein